MYVLLLSIRVLTGHVGTSPEFMVTVRRMEDTRRG